MTNWTKRPDLGALGSVGLALETALGTAVTPTLFVKATGGSDAQADYQWARENYKDGNLFENASSPAGITYQGKNFSAHAHPSMLLLVATGMLGAPTAGVITPYAAMNWDAKAPGQPFSAELQIPNAAVKITDGQFQGISLRSTGRTTPFDTTINYSAVKVEDLAENALTPVVLPSDAAFTFLDSTIQYNGALVSAESATLDISVGIAPLDSMNGTLYIDGFERTLDGTRCSGQFTLQGVSPSLKAAYNGHTRAPIVFSLKRGGKEFTVTVPTAEIETYTIPAGMDRIQPVVSWRAVSLDGSAPFTIKATNT